MKSEDSDYKEKYVFSRFVMPALLFFLAAILVKVIFH